MAEEKTTNLGINTDEIDDILSKKYTISSTLYPRCYITPSGKILKLDYYNSHMSVNHWLEDTLKNSQKIDLTDLGYIRVNLDSEGYIGLPTSRPTDIQFQVLEEVIDKYMNSPHTWRYWNSNELMVFVGSVDNHVFYNYPEVTTKYIINRLKLYYSSGRLLEDKPD